MDLEKARKHRAFARSNPGIHGLAAELGLDSSPPAYAWSPRAMHSSHQRSSTLERAVRRLDTTATTRAGGAHTARTRDLPARRERQIQRRDCHRADHRRNDRQDPRHTPTNETRTPRPDPSSRARVRDRQCHAHSAPAQISANRHSRRLANARRDPSAAGSSTKVDLASTTAGSLLVARTATAAGRAVATGTPLGRPPGNFH